MWGAPATGAASPTPPFSGGVPGAPPRSSSGGVEVAAVRSGVLAAGEGELWGSGVGVRSDRGEQDRRFPGAGEES